MCVYELSSNNPVPWTNTGGPIDNAFAGFGAAENKGIAFGGFCHNIVTLYKSWIEGASLRGGSYRFWDFLHDSYILRHSFS